MPIYRVTQTPGGGYWVSDSDTVGVAMDSAAGMAGYAIGSAWNAASRAGSRLKLRVAQSLMDQIGKAAEAEDWPQAYKLVRSFVRAHPTQPAGWEALCDVTGGYSALPSKERLEVAKTVEAHGVPKQDVVGLRVRIYFDCQDMRNLLREANTLITFEGEYRVVGFVGRARALLWLGDLDQALSDASACVSLMPSVGAYELRADVQWARKDLAKAVNDYSLALRLDPNYAEVLEKRASVYEEQGNTEAAEADQAAAVEVRRQVREADARPVLAPGECVCGYAKTPAGKPNCYRCGRPLQTAAGVVAAAAGKNEAPKPGSATEDQRLPNGCANCGYNKTPAGKHSCYRCGRPL
jgi:tetratricopeptide (TPR) repeat protein